MKTMKTMKAMKGLLFLLLGTLSISMADIIRGTVTDAKDNTPLAQVKASVGINSTLSNPDGTYELTTDVGIVSFPVMPKINFMWNSGNQTLFWSGYTGRVCIQVRNARGRLLNEHISHGNSNRFTFPDYAQGLYFVSIRTDQSELICKIIKLKNCSVFSSKNISKGAPSNSVSHAKRAAVNNVIYEKSGYLTQVKIVEGSQDNVNVQLKQANCIDGWCWGGFVPCKAPLNDVWAIREWESFMVGDDGLLLHVIGDQAEEIPTGTSVSLKGVFARSSNDVWIVGENSTVLHYDGSKINVHSVPVSGVELVEVHGNTMDIWAVGQGGVNLRYADGQWKNIPHDGDNSHGVYVDAGFLVKIVRSNSLLQTQSGIEQELWTKSGQPIEGMKCISASDRKWLWVGGKGKIWVDFNGGVRKFTDFDGEQFTGIHLNNDILIFAVTQQGSIYLYENFEWKKMQPSTSELSSVGGFAQATYAVGPDGFLRIFKDPNSGDLDLAENKDPLNGPTTTDPTTQTGKVILINTPAPVTVTVQLDYTYANGCGTTSPISEGHTLWAVSALGTDEAFMVGDVGTLLHIKGDQLTRINTGTRYPLRGVYARSATDVWAVGEKTTVVHYNGTGIEHIRLPVGAPKSLGPDIEEVYFDAVHGNSDILWGVGRFGAAVRLSGGIWEWYNTPYNNFKYGRFNHGVWVSSTDNVAVSVAEGAMYNWGANATAWTQTGQPVKVPRAVHGMARKDLWVVGTQADAWHDIPGGVVRYNFADDTSQAPNAELITGVYANTTDLVWGVSNFGKIWRYESAPDNWTWTGSKQDWPLLGISGSGQNAYAVGYQGFIHIKPQ